MKTSDESVSLIITILGFFVLVIMFAPISLDEPPTFDHSYADPDVKWVAGLDCRATKTLHNHWNRQEHKAQGWRWYPGRSPSTYFKNVPCDSYGNPIPFKKEN